MTKIGVLLVATAIALSAESPRDLRAYFQPKRPATAPAPRVADGCSMTDLLVGSAVEGSIVSTDCSQSDFFENGRLGSPADAYKLVVQENSIVTIESTAPDFEPDIFVIDSNGFQIAGDISLPDDRKATTIVHLDPGTYSVVASAKSTGSGAYRLTARAEAPRQCTAKPITLGQELEGAFEESDCRLIDLSPGFTDLTPIDRYLVTLDARKVLTVDYESAIAGGITIGSQDIGPLTASDQGSKVSVLASVNAGVYEVIVVGTGGQTGGYKLRTSESDLRPCVLQVVQQGEIVSGSLSESDCRDLDIFVPGSDPSWTDVWSFEVRDQPAIVTVTQRSAEFDTFLTLTDSAWNWLGLSDDFERTGFDSQVKISLNPGTYHALASTANLNGGGYTLKLESEPVRGCSVPELAASEVNGSLTSDDCRVFDIVVPSSDGSAADGYLVRATSETNYVVEIAAMGFTPTLRIYDSANVNVATGIVVDPGTLLRYEVSLAPGDYRFVVTTEDGLGDYRLSVAMR